MGKIQQMLFVFLFLLGVQSAVTFSGIGDPGSREHKDREDIFINNRLQREHDSSKWRVMSEIVTIQSPWLRIIGERLEDDHKQLLDYWRVEKADSAVVLTLHRDRLVFPKKSYRVGLNKATLDFPGGRVPEGMFPSKVVPEILERELGIADASSSCRIESLNAQQGWPVNSSFSNQKLFGFVAKINDSIVLNPELLHVNSYNPKETEELDALLEELACLQCRSILMEWLVRMRRKPDFDNNT
jgi:hypothetical protein